MQTQHASVCTLDCPDTCSLSVTVEDGRLTKVRGSRALPYTEGVICNKVAQHSVEVVHGSHRLLHPSMRVGRRGSGEFKRTTWEHALDLIHDRVKSVIGRWGPQAVMPLNYAGPHGLLALDSMSLRFFHKLGASQLFRGSLCGLVRNEAWAGTYGVAPGIGPEVAAGAELNVVWGNNATVTNLHLVRNVRAAKRRGGRLVVIDPLRTKIAEQADLHVAPKPGTDVVLGFALATELERLGAHAEAFIAEHVNGYEEYMALARQWDVDKAAIVCGVERDVIRTVAYWMAIAKTLVIAPGNGLERGRNGGSGIRAAIALPALMGKLNQQSGIVLGARGAFPRTPDRLTRPDLIPAGTRTININDVGRHLERDDLDPPLRALFIYNHNPIVVHPDQNRMKRGLAREEIFLVGIDVTMTETMQHCDVVLPAATHFEIHDLYPAYGHHWLQRAEPVIPPVGESLPNTEIFRKLAARFGFDDHCFKTSDRELMDEAVDPTDRRLRGTRPSEIPTTRALRMAYDEARPLALFDTVMPATPSGKIELASEVLAKRWGPSARLPSFRTRETAFPLSLVSPASDKRISSSLFGAGGRPSETPPLLMHPTDANSRALQGASKVRVLERARRGDLAAAHYRRN